MMGSCRFVFFHNLFPVLPFSVSSTSASMMLNKYFSQIELLEMRVEAALIHRAAHLDARARLHVDTRLQREARAWARLWSPEYRARTAVGVGMMFFQRESSSVRNFNL